MLQTIVAILVFTLGGLWFTGRGAKETPRVVTSPLLGRKTYGVILIVALVVVLLWR